MQSLHFYSKRSTVDPQELIFSLSLNVPELHLVKKSTTDFLTCSSLKLSRLCSYLTLCLECGPTPCCGQIPQDFYNFPQPPNRLSFPCNSHGVQLMSYPFLPCVADICEIASVLLPDPLNQRLCPIYSITLATHSRLNK